MNMFMLMVLLLSGTQVEHPSDALPETVGSYRLSEKLDYTPEGLYEYINGGAEMYISYDLVGMKGGKYTAAGEPEVAVEVYELKTARDAFGVYTQSRDRNEYDYGQGSLSYPETIVFWKDHYFVVITTSKATKAAGETIRRLAAMLDKAITTTGEIPAIVKKLPAEGLVDGGVLYFHHYIWLNAFYFIANHNILNIDNSIDAVLAKYGAADNRYYLLLVDYHNADKASAAWGQMKAQYVPEAASVKPLLMEDKTWAMLWRDGDVVGFVAGAPSEQACQALYDSYRKQP